MMKNLDIRKNIKTSCTKDKHFKQVCFLGSASPIDIKIKEVPGKKIFQEEVFPWL